VHLVGFIIRIYHDARSPEPLVVSKVSHLDHITLFYQISGQLLIFLAGCNEEFVLGMKKVRDTSTGTLTEYFDER
jgi:hypothetical protein